MNVIVSVAKQIKHSAQQAQVTICSQIKKANCFGLLFGVALALSPATTHAQDITTGLIGHWELDETAGTTIVDSSGNGHNGTLQGTDAATTTEAGHINTALHLDGGNDYITIPYNAQLELTNNAGSVAAWVRSDTDNFGQNTFWAAFRKLQHTNNASDGAFQLGFHQSGPADSMFLTGRFSSSNYKGTTPIAANTWYHIVMTWDTTNIYLYLDGAPERSGPKPTTFNYTANAGAYIGHGFSGAAFQYADGTIDEVRLYDRTLSAADVAALHAYTGTPPPDCASPDGYAGEILYNEDDNVMQYCNATDWIAIGPKVALSDGLVGHWTMDEGAGVTAADSTGGNDATLTGMEAADWVDGAMGGAVKFDDAAEYLSTGDTDIIGGATEASVCTWLYYIPASVTTDGSMVSKYAGSGWMLFVDDTAFYSSNQNTITFTPDDGLTVQVEGSPDLVTPQTWDHFCVTFKGSEYMKIYKNGALDTTLTTSIPAAIHDNNHDLRMGVTSSGSRALNGQLDDTRVYNRALSPTEVQSLYDMGPSCMEPPSTSPIAHWTMDDTTGNTIVDSSGNGLNGTWIDGSGNDVAEETEPGMVGNALHFDGSNDYITVPYTPILDLTDTGGTVMAWIRSDIAQVGQNRVWGIFRKQSHTNNAVAAAYEFGPHQSGSTSPMYLSSRYSGTYFKAGTTIIQPNQWYHVVMSWDSDNSYLYIDGNVERAGTKPNTNTYYQNAISTIGHGSSGAGQRTADGLIDDLRIYDETLTPLEISAIYGATGGQCTVALCSNPYGVKGELIYNADFHVMQYCNGGSWIAMGPPGDGGAACANPSGLAGTLRYDSDNDVLMYCEGDQWMAVAGHAASPIAPGSCPNPGDECPDGTVYAGLTPDGNVPMYVTHCDAGMSWDGSNCTGPRTSLPWNNGNSSGYTLTTAHSFDTGRLNTATLEITDSNSGSAGTQPHQAAEYCANLNQDGHSDWYLPAENEMSVIYTNNAAIGSFHASGWYWSSTAHNSNTAAAWAIAFGMGGGQGQGLKSVTSIGPDPTAIRCARNNNPAPVVDPCAGSPSPGDVCTDGTVYAGDTPDGSVAMYVTRCDAGQSWDGANCTGVRSTMAWNDGNNSYVTTGYTDTNTGRANSAGLASMDANDITAGMQDHIAAVYCENLSQDGHSDWYLPSLGELVVLSTNNAAIGNFESNNYWSSRENSNNQSWRRNIVTASNAITSKASASNVRCARNPSAAPTSSPVFAFTDVTDLPVSTLMVSGLAQVTGLVGAENITISGDGSPEYRICNNSLCGVVVQDWTSAGNTITNNQYVQVRTTTSGSNSTTNDIDVTIDATSDTWSATTIAVSATPCSGSPAIGTVCADGTVYAGLSPDGNAPMYTTPTDQAAGGVYWGTRGYSTGATSATTGEANTATVYADVMAGNGDANPDDGYYMDNASMICNNLNFAGHDDWYIPARDELDVLQTNRVAIGGFDTGYFWTSTENSSTHVWGQRFSDGFQTGSIAKQFQSALRCVRKTSADPCAGTPSPGDVCADGTVYAGITPDGSVPMYTTPNDQSAAAYWGTNGYATGATSATTGQTNSATIYADVMAGNGDSNPDDGATPNAFVLCNDLSFGGHSDWYLPALDELNVLYSNNAAISNFDTSGAYPNGWYWSSSENNPFAPDLQRFSDGNQNVNGKLNTHSVRCVRQ